MRIIVLMLVNMMCSMHSHLAFITINIDNAFNILNSARLRDVTWALEPHQTGAGHPYMGIYGIRVHHWV